MKIDIWMPIYINDYLADTMRLNAEKHGVYFLLMMDYWKHGYIPSDIEELSLIARVSPGNKSLQYIIDNFFILKGDKYAHNRIDKELENANSRRITAVENGKKGGRPRKGNNPQDNPEKTHRLNVGIPRKNQQGNPQKSSSSSSSSSSLPTTSTTEEEKKESPPSPDPDSNRQRFIEIKNHWKSKSNLPQSKLLDANMSVGHESLDMLKVFPNEDIFKAIDNFDKCFTKIEAKYRIKSFSNFMTIERIELWLSAATVEEYYPKEISVNQKEIDKIDEFLEIVKTNYSEEQKKPYLEKRERFVKLLEAENG